MSNILVGKTITDLQIAEDNGALRFVTDAGEIIARADGDCCSYTWVENVDPPALGFPAKVIAVEDIDMPTDPVAEASGNYDVLSYYGLKITTDKGDLLIDYRNDSNGYYGGNLVWPDEDYFYGGVYGQNVSKENWVNLPEQTP